MFICIRNHKQPNDRSSWSSLKKLGKIKKRYRDVVTEAIYGDKIEKRRKFFRCLFMKVNLKSFYLCFRLKQQQLDQLQKELNFLEEDIKRVEVRSLGSFFQTCHSHCFLESNQYQEERPILIKK